MCSYVFNNSSSNLYLRFFNQNWIPMNNKMIITITLKVTLGIFWKCFYLCICMYVYLYVHWTKFLPITQNNVFNKTIVYFAIKKRCKRHVLWLRPTSFPKHHEHFQFGKDGNNDVFFAFKICVKMFFYTDYQIIHSISRTN